MGKTKDPLIRPARSPLAFMSRGEHKVLDSRAACVDAMAEADPGSRHAAGDVLAAGQAAVRELDALRGRQ